jgi:hypothetical protein
MGLHMYHNHGIKGTSRRPDGTPRTSGGTSGKRMGRPPKARPMLSADDVCSAALEAMAPNGSIPIAAIPYYNAWVDQTRAFFVYLLG